MEGHGGRPSEQLNAQMQRHRGPEVSSKVSRRRAAQELTGIIEPVTVHYPGGEVEFAVAPVARF